MSTNYYRIPSEEEMIKKWRNLKGRVLNLELTPFNIERFFAIIQKRESKWDTISPWEEFIEDINIHLGKRSGGWKFLWNFHKNKYYHNKETLLEFIRSGRVVNEYGEEENVEEFIGMALNWEKDGKVKEEYRGAFTWENDLNIDGLRVSAYTEFS